MVAALGLVLGLLLVHILEPGALVLPRLATRADFGLAGMLWRCRLNACLALPADDVKKVRRHTAPPCARARAAPNPRQ